MQTAANSNDPNAAAPRAAESGSPSPTYTEEEKARMLEAYQRDVMERVPTLQEECHLGKVSDFCRISDFHNSKFQAAGERERLQQHQLVQFAAAAVDSFYLKGQMDHDGAQAMVYSFITSVNNNLYPTEETQGFFGVDVPCLESLVKACSLLDENKPASLDIEERRNFEEDTFGLLVYRTWKILIRTPDGRKVLLGEVLSQCEDEKEQAEMLNSYSAVEAVLVEALLSNTMRTKFIKWVGDMQVSNAMVNNYLMPRERKFLLDSFEAGEPVEWLHSKRKGFKQD